jgi:Spherulation-specific family 4
MPSPAALVRPGRPARPAGRARRLLACAALLAALATVAPLTAGSAASAAPAALRASGAAVPCQRVFVPAYFYSGSSWRRAIATKPAPGAMILNVDSGPGTSKLGHFATLVKLAQKAGITVIGYVPTSYGTRAAATVEAEVRDYESWYHVNGIFLDETADTAAELPYYRKVVFYIRRVAHGAHIWLNPGDYPNRGYVALSSVILTFEGSYASYQHVSVPRWVGQYQASRFAHVVYATPASGVTNAISLARRRHAGHLYLTNLPGEPNPYNALPGYWNREAAAVPSGCQ